MKTMMMALSAILISLALGLGHAAWAQSEPQYTDTYDQSESELLTPEELDDLLAPIALYPDPLIAQILPAATFVDQIDEAADFVRRYGKSSRIDDQPWDVSVKAVAHYPDVLNMMHERYEWTVSLGQAFIDQQQDVMDAIQRLRTEAKANGNLYSTPEQQVIYEEDVVRIVPATPEYVYVPVYDPQVVYVERYNPAYPLITFGVGLTIGAWLNRDCDWRQRRVYYHGWRGDGWVHRARPHVRDRRGVYISRRASVVNVNNRVLLHDSRRFRQELRNETWRRREQRGLPGPAPRVSRPGPGRIDQPRPGRIDQPRPGRIEQRGPGRGDQPRPGRIEQPRPGRGDQPRPGRGDQQRRQGSDQQPIPGAGQQRPAEAGQPPPAGRGEPARGQRPTASGQRAPTVIIQPPAATVQPPAATIRPPAATIQPPPTTVRPPVRTGPPAGRSGPSPAATVPQTRSATDPQHQPASRRRPEARPNAEGARRRPAERQIPGPTVITEPIPVVPPTTRPAVPPAARPAIPPTTRPAIPPISRPVVTPAPRPTVVPAPSPARQMMERPSSPRPAGIPTQRPAGPGRRQLQERQ